MLCASLVVEDPVASRWDLDHVVILRVLLVPFYCIIPPEEWNVAGEIIECLLVCGRVDFLKLILAIAWVRARPGVSPKAQAFVLVTPRP